VLAGVVGGLALTYLVIEREWRMAVTIAVTVPIIGLAAVQIRYAIFAMIAYLIIMADLRRILIPFVGWATTDPLLLVGPAFAIVLAATAFATGRAKLDTPLARWIALLIAIMVLQMFNPAQGGLVVGIAGAMFYIVPLLWYWVGRAYLTEADVNRLFYFVLIPMAIAAAFMGYYQSFYGYLPYQDQWYDIAGYTALGAKGIQAPISFFSSSSEFGNFLIVSTALLFAVVLKKKSYPLLILCAFFLVECFLIGSRGPIVKVLATCAAMWAVLGANRGTWMARGALGLVIAVAGLVWSLNQVPSISTTNERISHRVNRQSEGLLGAAEEGSSVRGHLGMMIHGYRRGFMNPIGSGLGSTTKAAAKFGGEGMSSEVDASNVFLSTGLPGGIAYHVVMFFMVLTSVRYWERTRSMTGLAIMGLLGCMVLMWLAGGQYAMSAIVWLCVGALDRMHRDLELSDSRVTE